MKTASTDQLTHEAGRYKSLAESIIIQAIKDATRHLGTEKHYKCSGHMYDLSESSSAAVHFLLTDAEVFPFWCQVAGLEADEVRRQLTRRLRYKRTYTLIRSLNRYRKGDAALKGES